MKRLILLGTLCLMGVFASLKADAQCNFGVIGGATFSSLEEKNTCATYYHAGLTLKFDLPAGFSIQPSLLYNVKGAQFQDMTLGTVKDIDLSVGYVEIPVSFQWGPDLLLFRPFLDVTPFFGYGVNNLVKGSDIVADTKNAWSAEGISRWEYGVGAGIGFDIWKFQIIGRYNWNLGPLYDETGRLRLTDKGNFRGYTLSLAFLF